MSEQPADRRMDVDVPVHSRPPKPDTWPVLAHVPRVSLTASGDLIKAGARSLSSDQTANRAVDQLRIVGDYDVEQSRLTPDSIGNKSLGTVFVDQPHNTGKQYSSENDESPTARNSASYSFATVDENDDDADLLASSYHQQQSTVLGDRAYRLHAAVAPYAGVIVAVALVLSAGLLYWLTMAPPQEATVDYEDYFGSSPVEWDSSDDATPLSGEGNGLQLYDESVDATISTQLPSAPSWLPGSATPVYNADQQLAESDASPLNADQPLASGNVNQIARVESPPLVAVPSDADFPTNLSAPVETSTSAPQFVRTDKADIDITKMFPIATEVAELPDASAPYETSTR